MLSGERQLSSAGSINKFILMEVIICSGTDIFSFLKGLFSRGLSIYYNRFINQYFVGLLIIDPRFTILLLHRVPLN
jgi:hypothetical protein